MSAEETIAATITAWLGDELERNNWNVPDRYAEWFDHGELAAAVVTALGLTEERAVSYPHGDLITGDPDYIEDMADQYGGEIIHRYVTAWVPDTEAKS